MHRLFEESAYRQDKILTTTQQIDNKVEKLSGKLELILDQLREELLDKLDIITNSCPRLVFLKIVDKSGIQRLKVHKELYHVFVVCEQHLGVHQLLDKDEPIRYEVTRQWFAKSLPIFRIMVDILSAGVPIFNYISNSLETNHIHGSNLDRSLVHMHELQELSEGITEMIQSTENEVAVEDMTDHNVDTCELLSTVDPRQTWKRILTKNERKWICINELCFT